MPCTHPHPIHKNSANGVHAQKIRLMVKGHLHLLVRVDMGHFVSFLFNGQSFSVLVYRILDLDFGIPYMAMDGQK